MTLHVVQDFQEWIGVIKQRVGVMDHGLLRSGTMAFHFYVNGTV